jgi:hypothetical protein
MGSFKESDCGMRSVAFTFNPTGRNFLPPVLISEHTWVDQQPNGKYYFVPNRGNPSNNDASCGEGGFCDSLYQTFLRDLDGTLGTGGDGGAIIPVSPGFAFEFPGCENSEKDFHAFSCPDMRPKQFHWESADPDCCGWDKRILGKFKIRRHSDDQSYWSRAMYDNTCKCQFGHSFYPFSIQPNISHDLTIFATMPKKISSLLLLR